MNVLYRVFFALFGKCICFLTVIIIQIVRWYTMYPVDELFPMINRYQISGHKLSS